MRSFLLVWIFVVHLMASGAAQDLTPPISWRNPNITSSRDERITIASAAIEKAISMLNLNEQFNDSIYAAEYTLYAQMADFDRLTNQTKYKQTLKQCFALAESYESPLNLQYGYAAVRAYTAYQDQSFLDQAVTSWTFGRKYTISKEQAALGAMDVKQFNITSSCNGATMAGGTYENADPSNTVISGLSSSVSALLAEATSNQTYLDAAIESSNFIQSHLLNPSSNIIWYSMSANVTCSPLTGDIPYGSGIFIEGLVVLANITRNVSTETLLRSTVVAVTTDAQWEDSNGIIDSLPSYPGGCFIVQALATLYERNTTLPDLREYTKEYIGVQYNAVIDLATSGGSNIYGPWTGPPSTSFSSDNQTTAISALLSGIQLVDDQPSSKSSATSNVIPSATGSTDTSPLPKKKSPTVTIVGGVVAGLAVIAIIIVGTLLLRRKHRRSRERHFAVDSSFSRMLTPFMDTSVPVSPEILGEHHINQAKHHDPGFSLAENRGEPSSPPGVATGRGADVHNEAMTSSASPPNPLHTERTEGMPTHDLLRLLSERLQSGRWNVVDDELPPQYHEEQTM
ncbi:hypothetical protein IW261DRAFT_1450877 [Armillaria novae-zelandiae]|uniref:Glycoside hydrolase family 76 protein n=1 Tax=Armillaria novae-zelandiae TaxID=153914 RepID=A0AA39PP31_9AGAR|nr:hypothetical protein IW261DRAFT_1450877 [Armillaria novae-zelandiae]